MHTQTSAVPHVFDAHLSPMYHLTSNAMPLWALNLPPHRILPPDRPPTAAPTLPLCILP